MTIQTINPATAELLETYHSTTLSSLEDIITKSVKAQIDWSKLSITQRAKFFFKLAEILKNKKDYYASLITTEMGKPINQSRAEIEKCAWICEHYALETEKYLEKRIIQTEHKKSYITYKPTGLIFGIMPWNFPFWQIFRFCVPTLMAGNTVIIKLAENCTGCILEVAKLFTEAGFPHHIFNNVLIDHDLAAKIIGDTRINGVSLTGSEKAGSIIGACAGQNLKKIVLELGGNDPYIILEDANLDLAAELCLKSRLNNTGQVCIAAKRLIVVNKVLDDFRNLILEKIKSFQIGDPTIEQYNIGPLARADLRDNLHKQVIDSINAGANCLLGGSPVDQMKGFYYPVTILDNVTNKTRAYHEELFGPVISLLEAKDEDDAIDIANDSKYGLAAAVFTQDINKGEEIARNKINAGTVVVNSMVSSDPRLPFGGIKSSGYGRELGEEGIKEFTNIKTVIVN